MSPEEHLISSFTQESLNDTEAVELLECMQDDAFKEQLIDDLCIDDLIARELNPLRSDEVFLENLSPLIPGALDDDFSDDVDPDGGDDFDPDPSGPDMPPIDPSSAGGISTTVKVFGGLILSSALIGGGIFIYQRVQPPTPPQVANPQTPLTPQIPAETRIIDIVADADEEVHTHPEVQNADPTRAYSWGLHTTKEGKSPCRVIIRFDLSSLPRDFDMATLRLYPGIVQGDEHEIFLHKTVDVDWDEQNVDLNNAPKEDGKEILKWIPTINIINSLDVTDAIRSQIEQGRPSITFSISIPQLGKGTGSVFYSREYQDTSIRPTLRVTASPEASQ